MGDIHEGDHMDEQIIYDDSEVKKIGPDDFRRPNLFCTYGFLLMIIAEEIGDLSHGFFQYFDPWQINDTEVIRLMPVESAAVDQQDLFIPEQVKGELFIVCDIELLNINFGEDVKSSLWFDTTDPRDIGERFIDILPLFVNPSAGNDIVFHALASA